jgi:putative ABC transport system permease protein
MNPARWLGWLVPAAEREFILGDLVEAHGDRPLRLTSELLRVGLSLRLRRDPPLASPHPPLTIPGLMDTLRADLVFSIRQLARRPGFTLLAALTLALGIGGTTAVYSVVHPVLFRPLPYPDADRIVAVAERDEQGAESNTGFATFAEMKRQATRFEGMAAVSSWLPTMLDGPEPERLVGQRVTGDFFRVLGIRPMLGRDFTPEEQIQGSQFVAIISHGLWQRRFGGDSLVIGRPLQLGISSYTVVGVLPASFESLHAPGAQIWAPLAYDATLPQACRTCRHLRVLGRLRDGVAPEQARAELDNISRVLVAEYPGDYPAAGMHVIPWQTQLTRSVRPALLAVLGAVVLVLLIACANVSALLLGRAMQRESEFAVRGALGAGRGRVVRQLLTESVVLSVLGGAAGVALAWYGVRALVALAPPALPQLRSIGLSANVLGFTAALSLVTGLAFGLVPAFAAARPDLFAALRPGGKTTGHRSRRLARAGLVIGEIALALMLLFGAGLLLRSLSRLLGVAPGFDPEGLLTLQVQTAGPRYQEDGAVWSYFARAEAAVRAVRGVEIAGWTSQLPLGGNFDRYGVVIDGKPSPNPALAPAADRYAVTPGYLEAMRIPLLRGRPIQPSDDSIAAPVVLINETFARTSWPGEDPLGARVRLGGPNRPWRTIVGIVGDVKHVSLDEALAPQVYLPSTQWFGADNPMLLAVRTTGQPAELAGAVRAALRGVDPGLPILGVATMEDVVSATAQQRRFAFVLFQVFAAIAVLLAAAGIYGVLAGSVTERTRELGIRAALGASRQGILQLVVAQGLRLTIAGVVAGAAGSLLLSRFLRRLLFGVSGNDPLTLGMVVVVLLAVAAAASLAPALRATRVSPLEAIRDQ